MRGEWREALQRLAASRVEADVISYSVAMSSAWRQAVGLCALLRRRLLRLDLVAATTALRGRGGRGVAWGGALARLRAMDLASLRPGLVSKSAAAGACSTPADAAMNSWRWAVRLAAPEDLIALNCSIAACGCAGSWRRGLLLLGAAPLCRLQRDVITYNSAAAAFGAPWRGTLEQLRAAGEDADVVTYNSSVRACSDRALELFEELQSRLLRPDGITFGALAESSSAGSWRRALLVRQAAARRGLYSAVACSAGISSCERSAQWQRAIQLFAEAQGAGLELDLTVRNAALAAVKGWRTALASLTETTKDLISFNSALGAFERAWQQALCLMLAMAHSGLRPDVASCTSVLRAGRYGGGFSWRRAWALLPGDGDGGDVVAPAVAAVCEVSEGDATSPVLLAALQRAGADSCRLQRRR
ncbi:unnamed protein product [Effrenium voratum]|nr:unnamed protein product [Effrenium voratum]